MNKSNHPIEPEDVMAYLDGELRIDREAATAAHLERCEECRSLAADFQGVSRRLTMWQVEPASPRITQTVTAAFEERAPRSWLEMLRPFSKWGVGAATALVLVVLFVSQRKALSPQPATPMQTVAFSVDGQPQSDQQARVFSSKAPMIVRTAQLTLTTKDFDKARAGLENILKAHQGYVGQLSVSGPVGSGRTLDATLRVPADQRDAVMAELKKLGRVESESQGGEEVTSQYVDLDARLTNARNTEQRMTDLLRQRTGKLSDVLAVEVEISRVRGEIERMEAEKKTLVNRVDFATLNVKVEEDYKAQLQAVPDSTLTRFRNTAVEGYRSMIGGVINVALFVVAYGPSLLLWAALLFFPIRFAWRRIR
jgi:hypothetical protein